ncbi:MAG: NEW3 domain-containing protein [Desulfobacteraceae bacterium]|nr:NEW3 domain-containing protein [Desulfobacteraceae bacterium]
MTRKGKLLIHALIWIGVVTFMGIGPLGTAWAANPSDGNHRPDRMLVMAPEYPGVEIARDQDSVSMNILFHNQGRTDETVQAWVAKAPKGWTARLKSYRYTVMGIHVPEGEDKTLTFEAIRDKDLGPGTYTFEIHAKTPDKRFQMAQTIEIKVSDEEKSDKGPHGIELTTSYPVLRGPSDGKFEFSLEVDCKLDKDALFELFAKGPEEWDINFKPAYEDKYISSLRLKAGGTKTVAVVVNPPPGTEPGNYPVTVQVTSGDAKAEANLEVNLTGTYALEVGTPDGLLSLNARQGRPANMSVYVKNTGSADNNGIQFLSFKPENWKVEFTPEKLDTIKPGELKQVEVSITPYAEALVGDYSVNVNVKGEKVSKPLEFRVTVNASSSWGWIGIGIILLVVIGLVGLFRWVGRR